MDDGIALSLGIPEREALPRGGLILQDLDEMILAVT
jgi:hypothetical protein